MAPAVLASKPLVQLAISGATSVDPAPLISAEAAAVEIVAMLPTAPTMAMRNLATCCESKVIPFGLLLPLCHRPCWYALAVAGSRCVQSVVCQLCEKRRCYKNVTTQHDVTC